MGNEKNPDAMTSEVHGGPIRHCPACGSERMLAVTNGFETNFLCEGCGRCWSVSLGRASLVDPLTCPGCGHETECRRRLVDELALEEAGGLRDDARIIDWNRGSAAPRP